MNRSPQQHPLIALGFDNPHDAAPVVRLVPKPQGAAEQAALKHFGFTPTSQHAVGVTHTRAGGFAAWDVAETPQEATRIAKLVADVAWARTTARTNPRAVLDRFYGVRAQLEAQTPHLLPPFFEEGARVLVGVGREDLAKQFFGCARDIEDIHALPIDPARRALVFREFALCGVVGAAVLRKEAIAVSRRMAPKDAYEYFLGLVLGQAERGMPAYAGVVADVRRLGTQAGLSQAEVDEDFCAAYVSSAAFVRSPGSLIHEVVRILPARKDRELGCVLRDVVPRRVAVGDYILGLQKTGVWDELVRDSSLWCGWLAMVFAHARRYGEFLQSPCMELVDAITAHPELVAGVSFDVCHVGIHGVYRDALVAAGAVCEGTPHGAAREESLGSHPALEDGVVPAPPVLGDAARDVLHQFFIGPQAFYCDRVALAHRLAEVLATPQAGGAVVDQVGLYVPLGVGCEKYILTRLASPLLDPVVAEELCAFFSWCVDVGLAGRWRMEKVEDFSPPLSRGQAMWVNSCLVLRDREGYVRLTEKRLEDSGWGSLFLPAETFRRGLADILTWHSSRNTDEKPQLGWENVALDEVAHALSMDTAFPPILWRVLFAGTYTQVGSFYSWPEHHRKALKLSNRALGQVEDIHHGCLGSELALVVGAGWHDDYLRTGPQVHQITTMWRELFGTPWIHLDDATFTDIAADIAHTGAAFFSSQPDYQAVEPRYQHTLFDAYLRLWDQVVPGSVPACNLAERIEAFRSYHVADSPIALGSTFDPGRFKASDPAEHSPRAVAEGYLDELVEYLRTGTSIVGDAHDPKHSAPECVAEASHTLGISPDAARYFLQLLALAHPGDANIKRWNGWKPAQLNKASQELVAAKLVIQAERKGTGRKVFLPGGWLNKSDTGVGLEVWKKPHYLLWDSPAHCPVIPSCPPLVPYPELFRHVWQRYELGDRPGYGH